MAAHQLDGVLRRLRRETAVGGIGTHADRELLARFACDRNEEAFATLVARHGPMVLGVCRRVLADSHAAEDAFQATFLVLARRGGSVRWPERLGNWLYGVAYRAASRVRVEEAKRRAHDQVKPARPSPDPLAEITARELVEVFDGELHRLPDACRAALVACYLGEKTRDEAAAELGWSLSTLKRRLERGRALLRARLARRGLTPALTLFPAVFAPAASAALPARLAESTVSAAIGFAVCSPTTSPGPVAVPAALAEGVLRTMPTTKLHLAAVLLVAASLVAAGVGMLPLSGAMGGPAQKETPKPVVVPADPPMVNADELQGTWTLVETYKAGKKVTPADVPTSHTRLVVAGTRVARHRETSSESGSVEVNPRATLKEFTFTWVAVEPAQLVQKPWVGIYEVDGDALKLCFNPANGIRPNDFATQPDSERVLFVYKREPAAKTDLQRLQGTWELAETRYDGKIVVDNRQGLIAHARIVIDGHWLTLPALREGMAGRRSKVEIDEASKPKRVTFDWYGGRAIGVYTLDGDTFQFCYEHGSKAPPSEFGAGPGSKNLLLVYKRQPAGKKDDGMSGGPPVVSRTDLQKLQGTWVLDANAVEPGPNFVDPPHDKLEIKGRTFTLHHISGGTERSSGSSFEMDEATSGGWIVFNWPNGKAHGIYAIDGDTFRFCYTPGTQEPPAKFGAGLASKSVLLVYRREKAAKEEASTPARPPVLQKSDLQKLQGTWLLDAVAPDRPAVKPAHSKLEIDGHSFTMHLLDGGSGHHHAKLQIDETANPRRIVFDWLGGQAHGIYQIDGDTFTFCYTPGTKAAPAEWGVGPAKLRPKENVVLIYKRQPRAAAGIPEDTAADTKERVAAEVLSQPLSPREAVEKHAGKEVRVVFRVASATSIFGGSVPRGQLPPFEVIPEAGKDDPAFSVLVSGELALVMDRFGVNQVNPGKFFKGRTVEVVGKIERLDPPAGAPDGKPSYRLAVSDWRKFRLLP